MQPEWMFVASDLEDLRDHVVLPENRRADYSDHDQRLLACSQVFVQDLLECVMVLNIYELWDLSKGNKVHERIINLNRRCILVNNIVISIAYNMLNKFKNLLQFFLQFQWDLPRVWAAERRLQCRTRQPGTRPHPCAGRARCTPRALPAKWDQFFNSPLSFIRKKVAFDLRKIDSDFSVA